jgi:hypothetical protein
MLSMNELGEIANIVFYIMVSFGFFVGIILMAAPEVYHPLNRALQREYGLKIRLLPKIEESAEVVDQVLNKHRIIAGMCISVSAFMLMLVYK